MVRGGWIGFWAAALSWVACGGGDDSAAALCPAGSIDCDGPECGSGSTRCGDSCVYADVDPAHCGGCSHACGGGEVCLKGTCVAGCVPGSSEPCYSGPGITAGIGACQNGTKTCNAEGTGYGACAGETVPEASDTCGNGVDDDCNGIVDDACSSASCTMLKAANPAAESGVYPIDPDGNGPLDARATYCYMDMDGEGWTLLAKTVKAELNALEIAKIKGGYWSDYSEKGYGSPELAERLYWLPLSHWRALTLLHPHNVFWQKSNLDDAAQVRVRDLSVGHAGQQHRWSWSTSALGYLEILPALKGVGFTTQEVDNDDHSGNCSKDFGLNGGFWYAQAGAYNQCSKPSMLNANGTIYRLDGVGNALAFTELYLHGELP